MMKHPPLLISHLGTDLFSSALQAAMTKVGLSTDGLVIGEKVHTPVCNFMLDSEGGLLSGVADMNSIEQLTVNQASVYLVVPNEI